MFLRLLTIILLSLSMVYDVTLFDVRLSFVEDYGWMDELSSSPSSSTSAAVAPAAAAKIISTTPITNDHYV